MIVEVPFRLQHPKPSAQHVRDRLLRSRLPCRSRYPDQRLAPKLPHRRSQCLQRHQRIFHRQQPRLSRITAQLILTHNCRNSAVPQCQLHKIVPIQPLPFHCKEKLPGPHGSGVDRVPLHQMFGIKPSLRRNKLGNPGKRQFHPFAPDCAVSHSNPAARNASRATSKSSNGIGPSRVTCTFSCPFPASSTISPGRASPTASATALRRSGSTLYFTPVFCSPTTASLMIDTGSSLRGLSDVSTTKSLPRPAASPISGRFFRSRSPPHPNTAITLPVTPAPE